MSRVRFSCCCFFSTFIWFFFGAQTCVDSVGATIFTFPVVIQLNVFIAVPNHFVFWKSKIFFLQVSTWRRQCGYLPHTSWKWPENKTNRVRRHFGDKMFSTVAKSVSGSVFVLNQVRVFVSGAYRHTQHAQTWLFTQKIISEEKRIQQTWLFTQKIISEEKIIISTLDKYCAFIIVNFILYFNKCTNRLRADSLSLNGILVVREKTNTAYFYPLRKAEVSISTYHDYSSGKEADWLTQFMPCRPVTGSAR